MGALARRDLSTYHHTFVENVTQPESFVGGVSDGTFGAAAMVFDQTEVFPRVNGTYGVAGIVYDQSFLLNRIQTQGRKSWFFFDREMVALGAGITSSRAERIGTTLNQTLLHGPVQYCLCHAYLVVVVLFVEDKRE